MAPAPRPLGLGSGRLRVLLLPLACACLAWACLAAAQPPQAAADEAGLLLRIKRAWGEPAALASWSAAAGAAPHCNWTYVACDAAGRVTSLALPNVTLAAGAVVPDDIGGLVALKVLDLSNTSVGGGFPASLYNCTGIARVDLSNNRLAGELPGDIGRLGGNLTYLALDHNNFTGAIPRAVSELKNLTYLALNENQLTGTIPTGIGELISLETIKLESNPFGAGILPESFKNLTKLRTVWLAQCNLTGEFPSYVTQMSEMEWLDLSGNAFTGNVLPGIWNLQKLQYLFLYNNDLSGDIIINSPIGAKGLVKIDLSMNQLTGTIPESFGSLMNLRYLNLFQNKLSGGIPASIAQLPSLVFLWLWNNSLSGGLPAELGKQTPLLRDIQIDDNNFSGPIPAGICSHQQLWVLTASGNSLNGSIPDGLASCSALIWLQLQDNELSGDVPAALWTVPKLLTLSLQNNGKLSGSLPEKLYWNITRIYIDNNQFTGQIPASATRLQKFHASNNLFSGDIPAGFAAGMPLLQELDLRKRRLAQAEEPWKVTPFQPLEFSEASVARGLADENLIGKGGSGCVYRVTYTSRTSGTGGTVAVKRIWTGGKLDKSLERAFASEADVLGHIRHSNIVKLLCCLCRAETKLLVYEFMDNGSLDKWLHGQKWLAGSAMARAPSVRRVPLDWPTRVRVAVGAARGLYYMHHECSPPIVHRDIKSSNILLDSELNAKVADFGLARMLVEAGKADTVSAVAGSFGYMAPECGYTRKVNEKVDVYSFGVVLLELVTGREANDGGEHGSLADWAWRHLQSGKSIADAADKCIRDAGYGDDVEAVFKLGIICTGRQPSTRPTMKDVLQILQRCEQAHQRTADEKVADFDAAPLLQVRGGSRRKQLSDAKVIDDGCKDGFDCSV
ncbi:LRR receptor-like serine/threonine-protein kinase HSL2 [Dichanthelium oligosanthes]|uniref:LRR receptor-like serine/threonine-protein kinase HSL2 n=1 Tax=Dichanthelium oligosanthes TaxID=888268 RepID=A0A1E5WMK0_9POAL|nr:LRR receptor-like serine/threonine-protein kinase HSL2 [Dichanthelium oligosanthes]